MLGNRHSYYHDHGCTRHCRFCAIKSGNKLALSEEPFKVAKAIRDWGLKYVVITSLCRDNLEDGGARHISDTVKAIKLLESSCWKK